MENWMESLSEEVAKRPLINLAIPGSHDSFTYNLDINGPVTPQECWAIRFACRVHVPGARGVVKRYAMTQSMDCTKQLTAGVRYFDVRLVRTREGFFACHGLCGPNIADIMKEINNFLDEHQKEVILFDVNHVYDMNANCNDNYHDTLLQCIEQGFQDKLCPQPKNVEALTLKQMQDLNQRVIVFYNYSNKSKVNGHNLWMEEGIASPYLNTTNGSRLIDFLDKQHKDTSKSDSLNHFFVYQGVVTPSTRMVLCHLSSSLKKLCAEPLAHPYVEWIKRVKPQKICLANFVEMENFIETVVQLNHTDD